jgi:uncharacterized protein (DUF2147 family)
MNHRNIVSRWKIAKESLCNKVSALQTLSKKISQDILAECGQNVGYRIEVGESLIIVGRGECLILQGKHPREFQRNITDPQSNIKYHWDISLKECEALVEAISNISDVQMRQCFELSLA